MVAARFQIAVDTLGSESPTTHIVAGARDFIDTNSDCGLTLIGRRSDFSDFPTNRCRVVDCPTAVPQHATLLDVLRKKSDSSLRTGLSLLANRSVDALVSTGNSGALMVLGRQIISTLPGITRPAMIKQFTRSTGSFWMLDLGANLARRRGLLSEFARIGGAYASSIGGLKEAKVALLNIGTEAHKGPQYLRDTAVELARDPNVNFVGYIEAHALFDGIADVVVTDGFTGNVVLKSIEGALGIARQHVQDALKSSHDAKNDSVSKQVNTSLNAQTYNGASLVGLRGVIVKCHGNTNHIGIRSALTLAKHEIIAQVPQCLESHFEQSQKLN
ncbi:MAG: hypothetical protein F4227_06525 [Gammaproteobacteria bacterium]|nr:hypothetical protein [Gammaproteobacteria bacterium]MYF02617.1 hypothetical protein [Gammaproteobacteria bacterium]